MLFRSPFDDVADELRGEHYLAWRRGEGAVRLLGRDGYSIDPERTSHMAEIFAKTLGQTPAAILDHAVAYGCLSASWHHEDDNAVEENRELSIAGAIRAVRASF